MLPELSDRRSEPADPLLVEQRLDQPTLSPVMLALAGQETLAQDPLLGLHRRSLRERTAVRGQHIPHQVGVVDHVKIQARNPDANHVAPFRGALQQPDRITTE